MQNTFSEIDNRNIQAAANMVQSMHDYFKFQMPSSGLNNSLKRALSRWLQKHERYIVKPENGGG